MYIKKSDIIKLNDIISIINSTDKKDEISNYLTKSVEDIDLFLSTLKKINKNQLNNITKINNENKQTNFEIKKYNKDEVITIIKENNGDISLLMKKYSKKDLEDMYYSIYNSKPLKIYNKQRIAEIIRSYIHTIERAEYLLGDIEF